MTLVRSLFFNLAFFLGTAVFALLLLPALLLPRRVLVRAGRLWARATERLLAALVGVRVEVRGRAHLPPGGCVVAAKHQSAWDTIAFLGLLDDACYVLKRELTWVPVYGWHAVKSGHIVIDRAGGARALRRLVDRARAALAEGRQVVIFPEGKRVAPGARLPYQPGVAALYARTDAAVVPVALNSGLAWGRRRFLKRPGTIVVEFLPPLPRGLDRAAFTAELERRIETATARLLAEAASGGRAGPSAGA